MRLVNGCKCQQVGCKGFIDRLHVNFDITVIFYFFIYFFKVFLSGANRLYGRLSFSQDFEQFGSLYMCAPRKDIGCSGIRNRYPRALSQPRYQWANLAPQTVWTLSWTLARGRQMSLTAKRHWTNAVLMFVYRLRRWAHIKTVSRPADTRGRINVSLTLVHRLRRWTNAKPTVILRLVSVVSLLNTGPLHKQCWYPVSLWINVMIIR